MDFLKSVFSDEPKAADSYSQAAPSQSRSRDPDVSSSDTDTWSFGARWIKTLASKSESVIENYRRDIEDLSSGLRRETAVIRDVASRAMKVLPSRLETGAAVAQESLESVGQAIDDIGSAVSQLIVEGKKSILDYESDGESYSENNYRSSEIGGGSRNSNEKPYSIIEAKILAVQIDIRTYSDDPEAPEAYAEWKKGFVLDEKTEDIKKLIENNEDIKDIYDELVPRRVDRETFWSRYFYRVNRVLKAEENRAKLVKRTILGREEEELSWDVDDAGDEQRDGSNSKGDLKKDILEKDCSNENVVMKKFECQESPKGEQGNKDGAAEIKSENVGMYKQKEISAGMFDQCELGAFKSEQKSEEKNYTDGSGKDSDFSVVSSQRSSHEEDDIGWDEIEYIASGDETTKMAADRADLRKRLSAAEEEEDLTWDIEDEEVSVK